MLVSQWEVEDAATARTMARFYEDLPGATARDALRTAQREVALVGLRPARLRRRLAPEPGREQRRRQRAALTDTAARHPAAPPPTK